LIRSDVEDLFGSPTFSSILNHASMRINVEFLYTPPTADCMAGHKRVFWKGCPWKTIEYHLDWNGRFHGYALRIQQTWKFCRFIPPYSTNELSVKAICGKSSNITLTG
jgi:hypothetical protein